jgi:hypothetical protein
MSKITYEQKMELIDRYKSRPMAIGDPDIFTALKADVVKAASNVTRKRVDQGAQRHPDAGIYNKAMGIYRDFLKRLGLPLTMEGKKAKDYNEAMYSILKTIRNFQRDNGKPHSDNDVLRGLEFMLSEHAWNRLPDFHQKRVGLPDIYSKLEEILKILRDGNDKKSAAENSLEQLELSIKAKRQSNGS